MRVIILTNPLSSINASILTEDNSVNLAILPLIFSSALGVKSGHDALNERCPVCPPEADIDWRIAHASDVLRIDGS